MPIEGDRLEKHVALAAAASMQEESQPSAVAAASDKAAIADYDWIGFDPRGVGSSIPALTCQPNYSAGPRENYNPTTRKILSYWLRRTRRYDRACQAHSPLQAALLRNMTTKDAARDMNSIRLALGRSQLTYYGFPYGTYLGQVYASMFPAHVKRLILDSNVDSRQRSGTGSTRNRPGSPSTRSWARSARTNGWTSSWAPVTTSRPG